MAQDTFASWDVTASNNTSITGDGGAVNIDEGCAPGNVNDALRAIMSACQLAYGAFPSGTSRPTYLTANKVWLNTTTATAPILTYYDGTDNIAIMTFNHTANTITLSASVSGTFLANIVEDVTPQLGANLDLNAFGITFPGATVTDVTGADTLLVSGTAGTSGDFALWNVDGDLVDGPTPTGADDFVVTGTAGTSGNLAQWNADGDLVDASVAVSSLATLTQGTATATTSGTSSTFGSIPTGTSHIIIALSDVSSNGVGELLIRIGDAGGVETTGYTSKASNDSSQATSSSGFIITVASAATNAASGVVILTLLDSADNTWVASGNIRQGTGNPDIAWSAGTKALSAELTQVQLVTSAGDTFDAGKWNIKYL